MRVVTQSTTLPPLTLRALQPADCDRLLTWIESSDALWQWSGPRSFTWPLDRGQLLRDLAARAQSGGLLAGVDAGGEMVAHVLIEAQRHHGLGHIGRVAVDPRRRGGGLGVALMRATARHAFDDLGLHRLQLTVYTFNAPALATYRAVGFAVDGVARESTLGSGGRWDGVTMSLLEPDYRHPLTYGDGIRLASPRDADAVAELLTELGYPHDREHAAAQLLAWMAEAHGEVLVAQAGDGAAVGVVAVHRVPSFERPGAFARVLALSVGAGQRRAGVGRRLMAAAERWAAAHGCTVVEVTSLRSREDAHAFYRALGYTDRCAESGRLIRSLDLAGG
ncbi:MAG TPA: GNAT family N-acetyltransferase [Solirubrobacteraceae bacterium]|nr:GNAT family N-acetyltransferase [Solirubrobacteraceae bacterium]